MVSFWRNRFPLFPLELTRNVFFEFFSKGVIFLALLNKTFLNRFIASVSMDKTVRHQFFHIQEIFFFFPISSTIFWSKTNSILKMKKSGFWWIIWACHCLTNGVWYFCVKIDWRGYKIFNSCFCSISTNKVSNPNYKRNEKQWNLCLQKKTDSVVFFHRNFCVE